MLGASLFTQASLHIVQTEESGEKEGRASLSFVFRQQDSKVSLIMTFNIYQSAFCGVDSTTIWGFTVLSIQRPSPLRCLVRRLRLRIPVAR